MHTKDKLLTEERDRLVKEFEILKEHLRREMAKSREFNYRATKVIDDSYTLLKRDENLFLLLK